jgi:hypothetical protein
MGKVKQRNWLIIITIFLVIVSGAGLFLSIQKKLSFNSCAYGENVYKSGESIPEYNGKTECKCNSDGSVDCNESTSQTGYNGYSSQNLEFTYKYSNLLSSETITMTQEEITSNSASYLDGVMKVSFERDTMCTEDGVVPTQAGFYQISSKDLKLTIMTNLDTTKYTTPCKISNSFEISGLSVILDNKFQIYYQSESGELKSLGACVQDNTLYGDQEAFKSKTSTSVCICDSGVVSCKEL